MSAPRDRRPGAVPVSSASAATLAAGARPLVPAAPSVAWPALLLVLSGASALVFQMLWIRQLSLVVGVEVHAVSIAISAFFGGLAFGGWYFGRRADLAANPMRLYAGLEIAVALLAVVSTLVLARAAAPFAWLETHVGFAAWLLPFVLVGLPATFMGGTLPVLMRSRRAIEAHVGRVGARLYAANTIGAVIGVLAVPFWLIPSFGIHGAALSASMLNVLIAAAAFAASRRQASAAGALPAAAADTGSASVPQVQMDSSARRRRMLAVWLYAAAGGVALGYEVAWSQAIVQFVSTRAFAFAIVLATYLCGLTLGSALVAKRVERSRDPWGMFALLIAGAGLIAVVTFYGLGEWIFIAQGALAGFVYSLTHSPTLAMCARFLVAGLGVVFLPTLLLGAAFPYALRLSVGTDDIGRGVGRVVALNTAGGIVGSLLTGFWLVPAFGLIHTFGALAGAACVVALLAAWRGAGGARFGVLVMAVLLGAAAVATPPQRLASLLTDARGGQLRFYEEGRGATVAVLEQSSGTHTFNRLYIQGVSNSGDAMTSLRYMRLQALLPLIIGRSQPKSALVIGLGTGITAGALLQYPGLSRRVTAELLPGVVSASTNFKGNYGVAQDSRMDIRVRDGRRELLRSDDRYDLITLEPPPPSAAGVANLYSTDFYRLASKRLSEGGVVAQWLPLPTQNEAETKALIASFIAVFPHASLWTTELHEMLLVGGQQPFVFDAASIRERYAQPGVAQALREVGIASPGALLATWVTDRSGMAYYVEDAAPVTDDRPRIEYAPWVGRQAFAPTLRHLLALQGEPPVSGADETFRSDFARSRQALLAFYQASLAALDGARNLWAQQLDLAMQLDGDNPYFRWFAGQRNSQNSESRQ